MKKPAKKTKETGLLENKALDKLKEIYLACKAAIIREDLADHQLKRVEVDLSVAPLDAKNIDVLIGHNRVISLELRN